MGFGLLTALMLETCKAGWGRAGLGEKRSSLFLSLFGREMKLNSAY
jgi:hypothetical protein